MKKVLAMAVAVFVLMAAGRAMAESFSFTTVNVPGSVWTGAYGINGSGEIAGYYSAPYPNGYSYAGGSFTTIDFPGADMNMTVAFGINDTGEITGFYVNSSGNERGFLYSGGAFSSFNYPNAYYTWGTGINGSGTIVGNLDDGRTQHGFLYSGGVFTGIDVPGAVGTDSWGINGAGDVVGDYYDSSRIHGFIYEGGSFQSFDFPGAAATYAYGINDNGDIVGTYTDNSGVYHGFLDVNGSFSSINDPLAQTTGFNKGTNAFGINDEGKITGWYYDATGNAHGFEAAADSVPEPPTLLLLGLGLTGLAAWGVVRAKSRRV